jgi:hypothetical protein
MMMENDLKMIAGNGFDIMKVDGKDLMSICLNGCTLSFDKVEIDSLFCVILSYSGQHKATIGYPMLPEFLRLCDKNEITVNDRMEAKDDD